MKIVYRQNSGTISMEIKKESILFLNGNVILTASWGDTVIIPLGDVVRIICN